MSESLRSQIAAAVREAAADLGLRVVAPFTAATADGRPVECIAHVADFGTSGGTLVCLGEEWQGTLQALGEGSDYFVSGLYPIYARYDRQLWIDTLVDWGWCGEDAPPAWYTGLSPWT